MAPIGCFGNHLVDWERKIINLGFIKIRLANGFGFTCLIEDSIKGMSDQLSN